MINELASSVIVSGLGALIAVLVAHGWRTWRLIRARRLSTISGAYITQFEQHGELVEALTQLTQVGLRVQGTAAEVETGRSWELDGQIDASGFFRCTSTSMCPRTGSRISKTMLLAIDRSGEALHGLWTSCQDAASQVKSGQYSMRRCRDR